MAINALCYPTLIGSFPGQDHRKALLLVERYCPEVPCWPQLPAFPQEGMLRQFSRGLPGFEADSLVLDPSTSDFESKMLAFYEEYLAIQEGAQPLLESSFAMQEDEAPGLFLLAEEVKSSRLKPQALKGQVTGPFTLGTAFKTPDEKALFYDPQWRDMVTKLVALKGAWQAAFLKDLGYTVFLFFDEPALAGFGSSAYVGVSEEDVVQALSEVAEAIKAQGALPGTHVCANTEWRLLVKAGVTVISFDAYDYLDRFLLFADDLKTFLENGGIVAWGIVPTLKPEALKNTTATELSARLKEALERLAQKTGVAPERIARQSLVTPSCGMGTLPEDLVEPALRLNREVADMLKEAFLV